jgi:hypothetical protein
MKPPTPSASHQAKALAGRRSGAYFRRAGWRGDRLYGSVTNGIAERYQRWQDRHRSPRSNEHATGSGPAQHPVKLLWVTATIVVNVERI